MVPRKPITPSTALKTALTGSAERWDGIVKWSAAIMTGVTQAWKFWQTRHSLVHSLALLLFLALSGTFLHFESMYSEVHWPLLHCVWRSSLSVAAQVKTG